MERPRAPPAVHARLAHHAPRRRGDGPGRGRACGGDVEDRFHSALAVVEEGVVKEGVVKEGVVKEGVVEEGVVKEGAVKEGAVKEGAVKEGVVEEGAEEARGQGASCQARHALDEEGLPSSQAMRRSLNLQTWSGTLP